MANQSSLNKIVSTLAAVPANEIVRVLVRPFMDDASGISESLDPKKFSSAVEYRSALITRQKEQQQPGKDELIQRALTMGLKAHPAASLNGVLVEGRANRVINLLQNGQFESAMLDEPIASSWAAAPK